MKEMKKSILITSLLYVIIGVLLIVFPGLLLDYSIFVLAAVLALLGIVSVISFFVKKIGDESNNGLFTGLIAIFVAFFVYWYRDMIQGLIPLVLGFVIVISGILTLQDAVNTIRIKSASWIPLLVTSLVKLGIGMFAVMYPNNTADLILRIIGIGFILSGISDLIVSKYVTNKIKSFLSKPAATAAQTTVETQATVIDEKD